MFTYQMLVIKIFKPLIGQTIEVYIDMIIKSKNPVEHTRHLEKTFELLMNYKIKPNH